MLGKPIKKISSKRPLRKISGGKAYMLFAVATTKTEDFFSESQVIKVLS